MKVPLVPLMTRKISGRSKKDSIPITRYWNGHLRKFGCTSFRITFRLITPTKKETPEQAACFARWVAVNQIAEAVRDSAYADIIFIDATSNIMGADRFEQWISVAAQTEYWRPKDPRLADNKQTDVKRTLADWKNDITGGKFTVYFGTDFKENASSMTLLKEKLAAVVLKVYPLSFDNCNVSDQFFTDAKYGYRRKTQTFISSSNSKRAYR